MYQRSSMRYAHAKGYTGVEYANTQDGEFILTCGADGDIRKWNGIDDDDPSSHCLGEFVVCIAHYGKRLLASTDLNTLQAYTFPDIERDGTLMRFTAPVTCVRVNTDYIAAGSEDTVIKVLKQGSTEAEVELKGHAGPVLAIDISCKGLLSSIAGDGTLKVWDLRADAKELKSVPGLPKVKTFESAECFGTPSFEPQHGRSLAYACGKEIIVLNTATWEVQCTLTDDQISSAYSCCQFSRDGQLLAAATKKGEISVFDFVRKQALKCETASSECSGIITSLVWNPVNSKDLAFCDNTGQLGTLFASENAALDHDDHLGEDENERVDGIDNYFGDVDIQENLEDADGDGISLEKLKKDTMRAYTNGDADEDSNDDNAEARSRRTSIAPSDVDRPQHSVFVNKQQRPFQPSATPIDLEHRYLVWNNVGIVRAHQDVAGDGSIDVEFHDASVHHALHIPNYNNNHNMASLSCTVLALSGEGATKLVCIALTTSGNKEWSAEMPDCEGVQALVATSKMVAVATDMRFLRLFSATGTQREVVSIPGPILALAGFHDRLFVCYHSAPAYDEQHLSALLLQTIGMSLRAREIRVPLVPGRKITWAGYSDCGSPVIADSMGLLQLYSMKSQLWYPICDTMKQSQSVSNNYFVIDVSERNQIIQAILCRGCSYPMTTPRPIVTELTMQMPLCELETEKSQLEDALIRASNFGLSDAEKSIKETAIKLFAIACRSELEMRAKELIEMIASPKLLPLAVKYASKLGRIHLSDNLSELLPQIEEQSKERELEERSMTADALSIIENSPLNSGLLLLQQTRSSSSTPAAKLAPKAMVLSNQKRNPFKRISAQVNISGKESQTDLDMSSQSSSVFSRSISHSMAIPSSVDDIEGKGQENTKGERAFMPWFAKNKQDLQEKYPEATSAELAKIGMREFKASSRPAASNQTNPFASKRKISEVEQTASSEIQPSSSFSSKLAKFENKK